MFKLKPKISFAPLMFQGTVEFPEMTFKEVKKDDTHKQPVFTNLHKPKLEQQSFSLF